MQKRFYFYLLISFLGFLEGSAAFANSLSAPPPGRKDYVNGYKLRLPTDPRVALHLKKKQQVCAISGSCEKKPEEEQGRYPNRYRPNTPQQRLIQSLRR